MSRTPAATLARLKVTYGAPFIIGQNSETGDFVAVHREGLCAPLSEPTPVLLELALQELVWTFGERAGTVPKRAGTIPRKVSRTGRGRRARGSG